MINHGTKLKEVVAGLFLFSKGNKTSVSSKEHEEIIVSVCETNYFRGTIYSTAVIIFELILIVFADLRYFRSYKGYLHNIWYGYLVLHAGLLFAGVVFIILPVVVRMERNCFTAVIIRHFPGIIHSVILSLLSMVTLVDLLNSGKMIVFVYGFFISSFLLLIEFPRNLAVFGFPMLFFIVGQRFIPIDYELKMYAVVNCIIIYITGIMISNISYRGFYNNLLGKLRLQEANRKLEHLAKHDDLTELSNRRFFEEQVDREFSLMERNMHEGVLLLLDVDLFKNVNDSYGHDVGDKVLKEIALVLKDAIRDIDITARWGGEEFIVFLPDTSRSTGIQVAERIRTKLSESSIETGSGIISITASIGGVCINPEPGLNYEDSYRLADEMLYNAKRAGRNRVVFYNPEEEQK